MIKIAIRKTFSDYVCSYFRRFSYSKNTIYALSSGQIKAGVAVIRVSGPKAKICMEMIAGVEAKPRFAHLRQFQNPESREIIDKGILIWFPGPNSFSGEDSVEFQCHGGPAIISKMLETLAKCPGCRPAEPGEFTQKAFFNGKLDLAEIEGLADLIHAETEAQRRQAFIQATGGISKKYAEWRNRIIKNTAHIEAFIDFSEEENISSDTLDVIKKDIEKLKCDISEHLKSARKGQRVREGVRTVIIGAPNVGKSSIMNIICQKPISIVTSTAGTTRDIIEVPFNIGGYPVLLADTAGLNKTTSDLIEKEGIMKAKEYIKTVDLILLVIDAEHLIQYPDLNSYLTDYYIKMGMKLTEKRILYFINKADLVKEDILKKYTNSNVIVLSCLKMYGIEGALSRVSAELRELCGFPTFESPTISHARHSFHLKQTLMALEEFLKTDLSQYTDLGLVAQQLRVAAQQIGKITGQVGSEDILNIIFKDFCIGK